VNLIRAALDCGDRIDHAQATILMTMPVEPDVSALFLNNAFDEPHD
jgi:hypothetical protein